MFQTKSVEKIKTHILCSIFFLFPPFFLFLLFYYFLFLSKTDIMWKNIVQAKRPQLTIWCMRFACCIPKATNTYSTATMVARKHLNVTLYVYCVSFYPPPPRVNEFVFHSPVRFHTSSKASLNKQR